MTPPRSLSAFRPHPLLLAALAGLVLPGITLPALAAPGPEAPSLTYTLTLGGVTGNDYARDVAAVGNGEAYVVGLTNASDFPTRAAFQSGFGGGIDAFVTKVNASGAILWSTYLGGSGIDQAHGAAVTSDGGVLVTGSTGSFGFPTTPGAFQTVRRDWDAFAVRFSPTGALVASTFYGGDGAEIGWDLDVDSQGNVYILGDSTSATVPTSPGAPSVTHETSDRELFLARLTPDLTTLAFGSFLGGSGADYPTAVSAGPAGDANVVGFTNSANLAEGTVPQSIPPGDVDGFLIRVDTVASRISLATYLGGRAADHAQDVDQVGDTVSVTGWTNSPDFPVTPGAVRSGLSPDDYDAFVTRIRISRDEESGVESAGISSSTLLGGNDSGPFGSATRATDDALGAVVHADGSATAVGYTSARDFPTVAPSQPAHRGGGTDVFAATVSADGRTITRGTYLGGAFEEAAYRVAAAGGALFVVGYTNSVAFGGPLDTPPPTPALAIFGQPTFDAFIAGYSGW